MDVKTGFSVNGNKLQLHVPITKVDEERRTVSGFATLNNLDSHGDIITTEASQKAFERWTAKNVREMHMPIAVGSVVDFTEKSFYDVDTEKSYSGVFVTAYISKGAEDTWQKVLDNTLKGFSVGGTINEASETYDEEQEDVVRVIKDYDLVELSLVDNPANPLANIFSVEKLEDGVMKYSGMAVETKVQNVLYCDDCPTVVLTRNDNQDCATHDKMVNIGWVEDAPGKDEAVKSLLADYKKSLEQDDSQEDGGGGVEDSIRISLGNGCELVFPADLIEGGVKMADKTDNEEVEKAEEVEEVDETETDEVVEKSDSDESDDEVEKAAEVSEVEVEELDAEDLVEKIVGRVESILKEARSESEASVEEAKSSFEETLDKFKKEIEERLNEFEENVSGLEKTVSNLEEGTAVKKSVEVDAGDEDDDETESFWAGTFLGSKSLTS